MRSKSTGLRGLGVRVSLVLAMCLAVMLALPNPDADRQTAMLDAPELALQPGPAVQ
jgi:hypothetical protein